MRDRESNMKGEDTGRGQLEGVGLVALELEKVFEHAVPDDRTPAERALVAHFDVQRRHVQLLFGQHLQRLPVAI